MPSKHTPRRCIQNPPHTPGRTHRRHRTPRRTGRPLRRSSRHRSIPRRSLRTGGRRFRRRNSHHPDTRCTDHHRPHMPRPHLRPRSCLRRNTRHSCQDCTRAARRRLPRHTRLPHHTEHSFPRALRIDRPPFRAGTRPHHPSSRRILQSRPRKWGRSWGWLETSPPTGPRSWSRSSRRPSPQWSQSALRRAAHRRPRSRTRAAQWSRMMQSKERVGA